MRTKEIGHVIPLSTGGFAVQVTHYGFGRALPAPRLLLQPGGHPFASGLAALDTLNQWRDDWRSVRHMLVTSDTPVHRPVERKAVARPAHVLPALAIAEPHPQDRKRKVRKATRVLPAIVSGASGPAA